MRLADVSPGCREHPRPVPGSGTWCLSVPVPEKGQFWGMNTKEVMADFFGLLL